MPWHVEKGKGCPSSKPWAVVKDSDDSVVGCHETEADAEGQVKALYANEDETARLARVEAVARGLATSFGDHRVG